MSPQRLILRALLLGGLLGSFGCERRPIGVDFSVDRDFEFDRLRRVAILEPIESKIAGIDRVIVDSASDALGSRYIVVYGNNLKRAVQLAGVESDVKALRVQLAVGQELEANLMRKIGKAIAVDAFFIEDVANFDQHQERDSSYTTVHTSTSSAFSTIAQSNRTTTVTAVRLTARLFDATSGLQVWTGSKFYETSRDLEYTGFKPIFEDINANFLMTIPAATGSFSQGGSMKTSH